MVERVFFATASAVTPSRKNPRSHSGPTARLQPGGRFSIRESRGDSCRRRSRPHGRPHGRSILSRFLSQQDEGHRHSRMQGPGDKMNSLSVSGFVFKQNQATAFPLQHRLRFFRASGHGRVVWQACCGGGGPASRESSRSLSLCCPPAGHAAGLVLARVLRLLTLKCLGNLPSECRHTRVVQKRTFCWCRAVGFPNRDDVQNGITKCLRMTRNLLQGSMGSNSFC
jgi:hypothetical protein